MVAWIELDWIGLDGGGVGIGVHEAGGGGMGELEWVEGLLRLGCVTGPIEQGTNCHGVCATVVDSF